MKLPDSNEAKKIIEKLMKYMSTDELNAVFDKSTHDAKETTNNIIGDINHTNYVFYKDKEFLRPTYFLFFINALIRNLFVCYYEQTKKIEGSQRAFNSIADMLQKCRHMVNEMRLEDEKNGN